MELIKVESYSELSEIAADFIIKRIKQNPHLVLGLATGGTPKGTYQQLIQQYKQGNVSFQNVKTINLDEYVGLPTSNPNSYRSYMNENLFNHTDFQLSNIHLPNGNALNMEEECKRYDSLLEEVKGADLQILGIGRNGHIGFNEPGTPFQTKTHIVTLADSTRKANARFFDHIDEVPTHAITMGIQSILSSDEILLLAFGEDKSEALYQLLNGAIHEDFPASALRTHKHVTIVVDSHALSKVFISSN